MVKIPTKFARYMYRYIVHVDRDIYLPTVTIYKQIHHGKVHSGHIFLWKYNSNLPAFPRPNIRVCMWILYMKWVTFTDREMALQRFISCHKYNNHELHYCALPTLLTIGVYVFAVHYFIFLDSPSCNILSIFRELFGNDCHSKL